MKTLQEVKKELFRSLSELQSGINSNNKFHDLWLRCRLQSLANLLDDDDIDYEYWEQIETEVDKMYEYKVEKL